MFEHLFQSLVEKLEELDADFLAMREEKLIDLYAPIRPAHLEIIRQSGLVFKTTLTLESREPFLVFRFTGVRTGVRTGVDLGSR